MILYTTATASGGYIHCAFLGSIANSRDVELALARGADLTRFAPCPGHALSDPDALGWPRGNEVMFTETAGTVWEKRGFRWHVVKEESKR